MKANLPSIEKFHYGRSMAYSYYEFGNYRIYDETASRVALFRVTWSGHEIGCREYYTDAVELCVKHATADTPWIASHKQW